MDLNPSLNLVGSSNLVDGVMLETVIVIRSDEEDSACGIRENRDTIDSNMKTDVLEEDLKIKESNDEKKSITCVIDMKCDGGIGDNLDGERVCRICHLSSDQTLETTTSSNSNSSSSNTANAADLIMLGCDCKAEMGIVHLHCAEAWFKLKGNRLCEICGETAKNITGVGDNRFMEEWNERRSSGSSGTSSSERRRGCWREQPFCNFLMACLVIAFVLPWFFRVNMF